MLSVKNLHASVDGKEILRGIDLEVRAGEVHAIMGPNGSGKSTLIKLLLKELEPTEGTITINGRKLNKIRRRQIPKFRRNIGVVFQDFRLLKDRNIYDNVAFAQKVIGESNRSIKKNVPKLLSMVGLAAKYRSYPRQLSGGEQQRVAIARALINKPDVLLLDEPLGALDLKLRREMQLELKRIQRESGITFIFVTHDQEEALTMSDRVAVMSAGHILQLGTPEDIYNEPQSAFVADFIGDSDIMAGTMVRDKLVRFLGCDFPCVDTGFGENADVDVVLRPEDVKLKPADDPVQGVPQGVVESLLFKGVHYEMKVRVGDSVLLVHSTHARPVGTQVKLTVAPEDIQVMRKSDYSPDILKRHAARV